MNNIYSVTIIILLIASMITIIYTLIRYKGNVTTKSTMDKESSGIKVSIMKLTKDEIKDIHERGYITPEEKVKEWEGMDLCAPGDAIGSASWRCKKFASCRDCLNDYANQRKEHTSFFKILKEVDIKTYGITKFEE